MFTWWNVDGDLLAESCQMPFEVEADDLMISLLTRPGDNVFTILHGLISDVEGLHRLRRLFGTSSNQL